MSNLKSVIFAAAALVLLATPAFADLASDKAAVDAAKAAGTVGEQADGYLGIVSGADGTVTAAVNEINAGRRQVYTQTATKSGVTPRCRGPGHRRAADRQDAGAASSSSRSAAAGRRSRC